MGPSAAAAAKNVTKEASELENPTKNRRASEESAVLRPPLSQPAASVAGRAFLITGGTQGLGLEIARQLKRAGASGLFLVSRSVSKGKAAVNELRDDACFVEFLPCDIGNAAECETLLDRIEDALPAGMVVTGLVNAAATTARGNLFSTTAQEFDQQMAVNVRAPFLLTQAVAKHMKERGSTGSIVNIGSCAAYGGAPFIVAYSASKAALCALTKNNAAELAPHGVRVNCVNMGWCATDHEGAIQAAQRGSTWLSQADATVPLGRILRPADVAVTVVFLLSDSSAMTTGTVMELHPEFPHGLISTADREDGR
jgi:NAD(P)-dependent dehydrogenase (short-subunit alcohol dehydrogenase family)